MLNFFIQTYHILELNFTISWVILRICQNRQDLPLKLWESTHLPNACPAHQTDMMRHSLKVLVDQYFYVKSCGSGYINTIGVQFTTKATSELFIGSISRHIRWRYATPSNCCKILWKKGIVTQNSEQKCSFMTKKCRCSCMAHAWSWRF